MQERGSFKTGNVGSINKKKQMAACKPVVVTELHSVAPGRC